MYCVGFYMEYSKHNKTNSKNLRKNMTKEERHLWYDFLRHYPIHFYRQRMIGPYIVDFYCPKAMLVIELDGSQHFEKTGLENDTLRDQYLADQSLMVLRIPNNEINYNFNNVCEYIDHIVKQRTNV